MIFSRIAKQHLSLFDAEPGSLLAPNNIAGGQVRLQNPQAQTSGFASFTRGLFEGAGNAANGILSGIGEEARRRAIQEEDPLIAQPGLVRGVGIGGVVLVGVAAVVGFLLLR